MERHDARLQPAHAADGRGRVVSGIVRKKQQDVHRGGRQLRLFAERRDDGVVGVCESDCVGKHHGRSQCQLRHK